jgi:hypothetical protein
MFLLLLMILKLLPGVGLVAESAIRLVSPFFNWC